MNLEDDEGSGGGGALDRMMGPDGGRPAAVNEFRRRGVLLRTKRESDGVQVLCPGTAVVQSGALGRSPSFQWAPDARDDDDDDTCAGGNGGVGSAVGDVGGGTAVTCGSLNDKGWTVVPAGTSKPSRNLSADRPVRPIHVDLDELKSFRLSDDGNQIVLIQKDGTNLGPLIFLEEGPDELIEAFKRHLCVRPSAMENLYMFTDARNEALDRSLSQLQLLSNTHSETVWKFVSDMRKDPYSTAMTAFSKITDKLVYSPIEEYYAEENRVNAASLLTQDSPLQQLGSSLLDVTTGQREDGEFEVVTSRPLLMDSLPRVERSTPLCQLDWELHFDSEGKITDLEELKEKIFRGGVEHEFRDEVWRFLLGFYRWESDTEERLTVRAQKEKDYFRMKAQWQSISSDQEERFTAFREHKCQIDKDVSRTDRTHPYFEGDDNPSTKVLQDILMTYIMYNFDLGYVQGMSDLLAPILYVMQNEVEAFWCFVGFMKMVSVNFDFEHGGVHRQLRELLDLLKSVDSDFYAYLDTKDSGNLFFCFRWLLIWFKRELAFAEVLRLWEVVWTGLPCRNFLLLVCVALLEDEKSAIVENNFGFNEILKHVNDMAFRFDLDHALKKAESIWLKIEAEDEFCRQGHSSESGGGRRHLITNAGRRVLGLPELNDADLKTVVSNNGGKQGPRVASKPVHIKDSRNGGGDGPTRARPSRLSGYNDDDDDDVDGTTGVAMAAASDTSKSSGGGTTPGGMNESLSIEVLGEIDEEFKFDHGVGGGTRRRSGND